jgi:hypothetical protein
LSTLAEEDPRRAIRNALDRIELAMRDRGADEVLLDHLAAERVVIEEAARVLSERDEGA